LVGFTLKEDSAYAADDDSSFLRREKVENSDLLVLSVQWLIDASLFFRCRRHPVEQAKLRTFFARPDERYNWALAPSSFGKIRHKPMLKIKPILTATLHTRMVLRLRMSMAQSW
jgi:hypothetical protein